MSCCYGSVSPESNIVSIWLPSLVTTNGDPGRVTNLPRWVGSGGQNKKFHSPTLARFVANEDDESALMRTNPTSLLDPTGRSTRLNSNFKKSP